MLGKQQGGNLEPWVAVVRIKNLFDYFAWYLASYLFPEIHLAQ